ncbi:UNVERIFIED_CONTAM: hypothetical protein PYX00_006779 [Menopon gallinae]|uniref:Uncharacterized protein n=1 Tax=Menopon gallinae TaxID=328185 RepID=A0AAW2HWL6_9NEOP
MQFHMWQLGFLKSIHLINCELLSFRVFVKMHGGFKSEKSTQCGLEEFFYDESALVIKKFSDVPEELDIKSEGNLN